MIDWSGELDDALSDEYDERPEDADQITVTFPLEDPSWGEQEKVFFRIEEE